MKFWTYFKFLILDLRKGFANAITLYLQMLTIQISIQTDNHTYRKVLQLKQVLLRNGSDVLKP